MDKTAICWSEPVGQYFSGFKSVELKLKKALESINPLVVPSGCIDWVFTFCISPLLPEI